MEEGAPSPQQAGKQRIGVDVDRGSGTGALRKTLQELWLSRG